MNLYEDNFGLIIINLFFIIKFLSFRAMEFECCCLFVKEYNIEVESTIG